MTESGPT